MGEQVAQEILGQVGKAIEVAEGNLGFHHPELGQVTGGVGILGAEGGAEGVHIGHGLGKDFGLQLAADGQERRAAKEVLAVVHGTVPDSVQSWRVVDIEGGDAEHGSGPLGVAGGDDGSLDVEESALLVELVDAEGHCVADAGHGAEGVGAGAQVGQLAQKFQGVPFFLEGVLLRVGAAELLDALGKNFVALAAAQGFLEGAGNADAATGAELSDQRLVGAGGVDDYLEVGKGGAVVDLDEGDCAGGTDGFDPALDDEGVISGQFFKAEQVFDAGARLRSWHGVPPLLLFVAAVR